ncbi:CidA/LrgA family protein [Vitreoscilla stercoraria]|uniref:CidA/LrgA family protein n=1 Tax=Vitreoscilla stercoraria TaxID=61 RepID=A0ABY4E8U1_VITST|nr:CidA/LrgA family protein [Vitreoscilla stercoraria]UOO92169.1 CidA/LrgA family protein [Vitreoscilla stercoraria]
MIKGLLAISAALAVGEAIVYLTQWPLPASVLGLIALFLALQLKWVKIEELTAITDFLMQHLALFLIPPCVALITHLDLIQRDFFALLGASVLSSVLLIWVVGWIEQLLAPKERS